MTDFDINKELEEINVTDFVHNLSITYTTIQNEIINKNIEHFYHVHRLGSRVPLIIILFGSESWSQSSLRYFSKIANVLSLSYISRFEFVEALKVLLKRYGSSCGIVLNFVNNSEIDFKLFQSLEGSKFFCSEISCYLCISKYNCFDDYHAKKISCHNNKILYLTMRGSNDYDLQNALILSMLQQRLNLPSLEWNWQYEQSDNLFLFKNLVYKNYDKWKATEARGDVIEGTRIVPMKIFKDDDNFHSPMAILNSFPNLGLVIDLSNDEGSYNINRFKDEGIQYTRIQIESKQIPSSNDIFHFINVLKKFITKNPEKDVIVHCHYGYNRSGLMICSFLIEYLKVSVHEALERFKRARPPGIKHQNYIDKLLIRYSDLDSAKNHQH
jgi:protein-tyrosine phosphatase